MSEFLRVERQGPVATLWIDRQPKMNTMTVAMRNEFPGIFEGLEDTGELVAHGHRHRIHLRLAVDPQRGHRPLALHPEELAHGITSTLPLFLRSSTCWTAARASFNGNARSITGFKRPSTT